MHDSSTDVLRCAIEALLKVPAPVNDEEARTIFRQLSTTSEGLDKRFLDLKQALMSAPAMQQLDGGIPVWDNQPCAPASLETSVLYCWRNAAVEGAETTIQRLITFCQPPAGVLPCYSAAFVSGMSPATSTTITTAGDVAVHPWAGVAESPIGQQFLRALPISERTELLARAPGSLWVRRVNVPFGWTAPTQTRLQQAKRSEDRYERDLEAMILMSLVVQPGPIAPIAHVLIPAVSCPLGGAVVRPFGPRPQPSRTFYGDDMVHLLSLYSDFLHMWPSLSAGEQERFLVPLRRMRRALLVDTPLIDVAIEFRIALEATFDDNKEISDRTFRVALHAARWLGSSLEERQAILQSVKKLYRYLSGPVHSGMAKLDNKFAENIALSADFIVKGIEKTLRQKKLPDWQQIELVEPPDQQIWVHAPADSGVLQFNRPPA